MASPAELLALAERVEAAEGPMAYALLGFAWDAIYGGREHGLSLEGEARGAWVSRRLAFQRLLDAGGFLDAAMTLVPEGCFPIIDCDPRCIEVELMRLTDRTDNGLGAVSLSSAATPALALTAACLLALASRGDEQ